MSLKEIAEFLSDKPDDISLIPKSIIKLACKQLGLDNTSIETALLKSHEILQEQVDEPSIRANYIDDISRHLEHIKLLAVYFENEVKLLSAKHYPPKEKGITEQDRKNQVEIEIHPFKMVRDLLNGYSQLLELRLSSQISLLSFEKSRTQ